MKIIFTGGGSGGHLFPILAICRALRKMHPPKDLDLFYLGPKNGQEVLDLLQKENCKIKRIISGKLRRYFSLKNLIDIFKVPIGFLQSFFYLFFLAPDLVFSKGGFGSFPVVVSAKILNIPIFLHESDVAPGLAARIESKWALEIFVSFLSTEYFPKKKMVLVGNPIRQELIKKAEAKNALGLQGNKPLVLVMGGSQGAQRINDLILEILPEMLADFEIIHQTGKKNFAQVKKEAEVVMPEKLKKYYHPFPFLEEKTLAAALMGCHFVVSRAGSGSIFEIAAAGKPAILIPLKNSAQDHQLKNAYVFSEAGGAIVIEENNLQPHFFLERLKYFFSRKDVLENMAKKSLDFSRPRAAKIIASYLIEYLK